jgi:hypothetical protein
MQRRPETGCIPTGYELMLRAAGAKGIDFDAFQDAFDLDKDLPPGAQRLNHFKSVGDAVTAKYPSVAFVDRHFPKGKGTEKLAFIEAQIAKGRPVLIALALASLGQSGWHIMPVVDADDTRLALLNRVNKDDTLDVRWLLKADLVHIHDAYPGGEEVAYLERC